MSRLARRARSTPASESRTLFVDLDGTLITTDTLWESLLRLIKQNPIFLLSLPLWLVRGKAFFKKAIASRVSFDVARLPWRADVVAFLRRESSKGRKLVLLTGADELIAHAVADHLGLFSDVIASDGKVNLIGKRKLERIHALGGGPFDYIGDSKLDLPLWTSAKKAIVISPSPSLRAKLERDGIVGEEIGERQSILKPLFKALRPQQWLKNVLIFLPLVFAHQVTNEMKIKASLFMFFAFCLCASAIYIVNDLLDLEEDRTHPEKQRRPFACGQLQPQWGLFASASLLATGLLLAHALLNRTAVEFLALYVLATLIYSTSFKSKTFLDVLTLSSLYTLRIFCGGVAAEVPVSDWLFAFSMFFFLSLALLKRYGELINLQKVGVTTKRGTNYTIGDASIVACFGICSGVLSVLVLALYNQSAQVAVLYKNVQLLWLICPLLLYWIARTWFCAHRGLMTYDPILFATRDRTSYLVLALILGVMALAVSS